MSDEPEELAQDVEEAAQPEPSPRAQSNLPLIGLIFLLPLVLMFVTSVVCIAVVIARN
jgi:hypothetical protein